jgi:methionine-gamma-lyase
LAFKAGQEEAEIEEILFNSGMQDRLKMIYMETPANPTNDLIDIGMCAQIARAHSTDKKQVMVAVDNTYMGPLWQHPLQHGADIVLYSATKYIRAMRDVTGAT